MSSDRGSIARPISISPPPKRRRMHENSPKPHFEERQRNDNDLHERQGSPQDGTSTDITKGKTALSQPASRTVPSPVRLNFVEELAPPSNVDTVSLGGILGNVMIRECWLFNYLFDLDFVM